MVVEISLSYDPEDTNQMDINLDPAVLKGRVQSPMS
jgi:hypothetical protein